MHMKTDSVVSSTEQLQLINTIKAQIRQAQYQTILQVNSQLILLYWQIGTLLNENAAYGNSFVERLAAEIRSDFPRMKGFSVRNLWYMKKFAAMTDKEILQTVSAELPWSHNIVLMEKVKDMEPRLWYARKAIENGWSKNVLTHQIEGRLYERQETAPKISNFSQLLSKPQSELARDTMKDPYIFDFIEMREDMLERDIEDALVKDVTKTMLELGKGFAFVGQQYHLNVGGDDFFIDLLFYNLNLRCYFVIELKTGDFKPEYAGQLNFYLSAVDSQLRHEWDNPSIGLILCKNKNNVVAEYSLRDMSKPMGVSEYRLTRELPEDLKTQLPTGADFNK
ncbi:Predicted nuclease of restriction endonuclease-like (RecB) superfamily, DUF1016 family [Selenomonas ruminantium]|uniref:Predicted nuclease of restriction endonuclease-like (RecB) superfamily, DUF1016 family n=2 Tax=Selenomonas ruminantium TaxID=971 RepID=A0A1K1N5B8_SELRU|nr:Predicted nuclease of restriction endonuclease-like (RecB) superfamily, DUF1016 family [Selenomonas ruminantium]SFW30445.1 Predicted nuclease of restriction endonuclease-like (RecB) superfamily, DUF1016 family [Selenomonas ruminantium]